MDIVFILVPAALILGLLFLWAFIHTVRSGQYEDLETPAYRILNEVRFTHKEKNK